MPTIEIAATQAAPVVTMEQQHLLIVSIGPVQDFIAAARKCQDLWFGSFLLSELARELAQGLTDQKAQLIFPGSKLLADERSVANKIVAALPPGLHPSVAVTLASQRMRSWLHQLTECAFAKCARRVQAAAHTGETLFLQDVAQQQVDDLIEVQWVAVPLTSYAEAHADAERLLAWRKNTRNFSAVPWKADHVPKSSIDGQRESVILETFFDRTKNKEHLGARYGLGQNERLCGVGVLKRYGAEIVDQPETEEERRLPITVRPIFHSNSHVAAGPLFQRIKQIGTPAQDALDAYISELKKLTVVLQHFEVRPKHSDSQRYDGYLLYSDRLPDVFKEESAVPLDRESQQTAVRAAQNKLQSLFATLNCAQPEAYYVMLAADGDRMGVAIESLRKQADAANQHRTLSDALARFARTVREVVEDKHQGQGSLIYSGGDDVLALLPLHTALACARTLSEQFTTIVHPACLDLQQKPTLSVGLAVVHHLEHMGQARRLAHDAEKLAKQTRNALAIIVDKRSGGTIQVSGQWNEAELPIDRRIEQFIDLLNADDLPDGVAFELLEVIAPFEAPSPTHDAEHEVQSKEIQSLVRRVLDRKRASGGTTELGKELIEQLVARINVSNPIAAVRALSYELQIAREFARAKRLAEGT